MLLTSVGHGSNPLLLHTKSCTLPCTIYLPKYSLTFSEKGFQSLSELCYTVFVFVINVIWPNLIV